MSNSTATLRLIAGGTISIEALADSLGKSKKTVVKYTQTLKGLGYISVCDELDKAMGTLARGMYVITPAGEAFVASGEEIKPGKTGERPRKRTVGLRDRAWWHFRAHKVATLKELLSTHANGTEKAASINLYKYIAALESAGIVKRLGKQPAKQSKGRVVWSLEKDLGVLAPVWRQTNHEVYDPNGDRVFKLPEKEVAGEQAQ